MKMRIRMRARAAVLAAGTLAMMPTAVIAQSALGANYNEHFEDVDYGEVDRAALLLVAAKARVR